MNAIYGQGCYYYIRLEVRLGHYFFLGPIGLVNWPHILDNGPYLSPWDVKSLGTFCPLGRFVLGRFVCASFLLDLAKAQCPILGIFLLPRAHSSPQIRFKTAAAILAVKQGLFTYITCRRFLILRSENFSRLLNWPATILLPSSKNQGMLLPGRDSPACKDLEGLLFLPQKKNDLRHDTKLLLSA